MWKPPENSGTGASHVHHQRVKAISIGSFAHQRLKQAQSAEVTSIFNRGLYLDLKGDWICLADAELGCSPITINIDQKFANGWLHRFKIGKLVEIKPFGFYLDNCPIISVEGLHPWRPEKPPKWSKTLLKRSLDEIGFHSQEKIPAEGLGCFLLSSQKRKLRSLESIAADWPIKVLGNWLTNSLEAPIPLPLDNRSVTSLLGLGPGLTPSGDDFLGGMLIALQALEKVEMRNQLFFHIRNQFKNTGPVSRAHLKAAATGEGHDVIHRLLNALMKGDVTQISLAVEKIRLLGHTSGWDTLAGLVTVIKKTIL